MLVLGKKIFIILSTNMATLSHGRKLPMHYNLVPRDFLFSIMAASGKKTLGHSNLKLILSWTMIG